MKKRFKIIIAVVFTCLIGMVGFSQTSTHTITSTTITPKPTLTNVANNLHKSYNKEFNELLYVYKEAWYLFAKVGALKITIYTKEGSVLKALTFPTLSMGRDVYMNALIMAMYNSDLSLGKVIIDNTTINTINNNIKTDIDNSNLVSYLNTHNEYSDKTGTVGHTEYDLSYDERLEKHNIKGCLIAENCTQNGSMESLRGDIRRVLKSYYAFRNQTAHWGEFMDIDYNYYTTAIAKTPGSKYTYSTTIFSRHKLENSK